MVRLRLFSWNLGVLAALGLTAFGGGCSPIPPPNGPLEAVQPVSQTPRMGNVYIVRGLFGNFSMGMDGLQEELEAQGVRSVVYQHLQAGALADAIARRYHGVWQAEPLVLVGHSLGADDVVDIATRLQEQQVPVQLLITLDPVFADPVPANVRHAVNYYRSTPLDWFPALRGIPLKWQRGASGRLDNLELSEHPELANALTNHFTIDGSPKVRQSIVKQVLAVCPTRSPAMADSGKRAPVALPAISDARAGSLGSEP